MKASNPLNTSGLSDSIPSDRIENTTAPPATPRLLREASYESRYSPSTVTVIRRRWAAVRCSHR